MHELPDAPYGYDVWTHTEVVPGASHFFVGRTDRVVELALGYVSSVSSAR